MCGVSRKIFFELTCRLHEHRTALVFGDDIQAHSLGIVMSPRDRGEPIVIADEHESADRRVDPLQTNRCTA